ncbi:MAG: aspartate 1-decarboxylase [Zetaproteobacteria bacterium CG12_big_fil_rev_8_21_14_0_65_54_13]|nr:MAG: aspartate 1-decarboxylase [Zetaproteobacteria bacterium CG12_big_fil_rev_8_21_14_0_65_54_13]PIX54058.1 MAG: aspartate 1-decarboxylase [Zetaproteobacteria bacterium CG_4_10_14_3_um_filter_54_28]PJA28906.1 MAG: aspartate 1-decarboxylase [Zetaproteobacteria bacterium CG_4_9_14_3_um_filter_54_145]
MKLTMLKSKIHRATVTHAELDYEGSCAIDQDLLDAANILQFEQLHIYNVANGERFTTYAITAPRGSGTIGVNGAAAHKASPGDLLIICTYAGMQASDAAHFNPALVYVDSSNGISHTSHGHLAAA